MNTESEVILDYCKKILTGEELHSFDKKLGNNFSERCIETPWVASIIRGYKFESILDIGFTMANLDYLGLLLEIRKKFKISLEVIDIVKPERVKTRYPKEWVREVLEIPLVIGDISKSVNFSRQFDAVTCISTIEHVGFDIASQNNPKTSFERVLDTIDVPTSRDIETSKIVLNNIARALKTSGKLLISVPIGKGGPIIVKDSLGYYCCYWEYNRGSWDEIVDHDKFHLLEQYLFKLDVDGFWKKIDDISILASLGSPMKTHVEGLGIALLVKK